MPDILDNTGLQVKSYAEISDELKNSFHQIYGGDLNLESNTQDGQMIGLFAQSATDIREIIMSVWNDLFADTAQGMALDRLFSVIGVRRNTGSKARVLITVVTDRPVHLQGLDGVNNLNAFTVSDSMGNNYNLELSADFPSGETQAVFVAEFEGYRQMQINTITTIETIIRGVLSIANLQEPIENGTDFETDAEFRNRALLGNPSGANIGTKSLIEAAILELDDVNEVLVIEDVGQISIIVKGGNPQDIANAIYATKAAGIETLGNISIPINNSVIKFTFATPQSLYYKVDLHDNNGSSYIDDVAIKNLLVQKIFRINETASQISLASIINEMFPNLLISNSLIRSNTVNWSENITPANNLYFQLQPQFITINKV